MEKSEEVEKHIHRLFDTIDASLHAKEIMPSGRIREREFFRVSPEKAYAVFDIVSRLRGDNDCLKLIEPNEEQIEDERIAEQTARRPNFRFSMLEIPIGSELKFLYDEECVCCTKDEGTTVEYEGSDYSLSKLAGKLLAEKRKWNPGFQQGSKYFTYQDNTLEDLRNMRENREPNEI